MEMCIRDRLRMEYWLSYPALIAGLAMVLSLIHIYRTTRAWRITFTTGLTNA